MATNNTNGNWSSFSGSGSSRPGGGGAAAAGGGGGSQWRPGGVQRREFPAAFRGGNPQRGRGGGEKLYTRQWYEQQRREKETADQRVETDAGKSREMNDVNFPTLVSSFSAPIARATGHGWHQRGSDLARAWGEAADEQKEVDILRKQLDEHRAIRDQVFAGSVHHMQMSYRAPSTNHYAEDAYPEEEEEGGESPKMGGAAGDEVWTTVDSGTKKNRPVRRTGDWHHLNEHEEPQDDSVWGGGQHEEGDSVW